MSCSRTTPSSRARCTSARRSMSPRRPPGSGFSTRIYRDRWLGGDRQLRRRSSAPPAPRASPGMTPRRAAQRQRRHRPREGRRGGEALAERGHRHLREPDGRDVPRRPEGQRLPPRAHHRPGRHARQRALPLLRLRRARCRPVDVHGYVIGGHTDTTMVPVVSQTRIGGVPLTDLSRRTRSGAGRPRHARRRRNRRALKTGSAYYAPSAATIAMVEAVLLDQRRLHALLGLPPGRIRHQRTCSPAPSASWARAASSAPSNCH